MLSKLLLCLNIDIGSIVAITTPEITTEINNILYSGEQPGASGLVYDSLKGLMFFTYIFKEIFLKCLNHRSSL